MWWAVATILLVLWVLAVASGAALGWWTHMFLAWAMLALVLAVLSTVRQARGRPLLKAAAARSKP